MEDTDGAPEVELYTDRRIAEFLLNNATDAEEYEFARSEVLAMGLDPDQIAHEKPLIHA